MSNKFQEHIRAIAEYMPELCTLPGLFFYTFLIYLLGLFYSWLMDPTLERMKADLDNSRINTDKGARMRQ